MLMIISPAKTLDFETPVTTESYSIPDYLEKSAELVDIMKKKSLRDLVNMMQVSQKIAELNVERFKSWKLPFNPGNARQAFLAFKGDVYKRQGLSMVVPFKRKAYRKGLRMLGVL